MHPRLYALLFAFLLPLLSFAATPAINLTVDVTDPNPPLFAFSVRAGTTPPITVTCVTNLTTGGAYTEFSTGWTPEFNYFLNDSASAGKTITGTLAPATGIITFNTLTNSFPAHGDFFAEVYLNNGTSPKLTIAQGALKVDRSPSSGSIADLNLSPRINWDITTSIGTVPWSLLTEPIFLASAACNITAAMTNQWSVAYTNYGPRIAATEAFQTAQILSNAAFEIRISSNETFRTTTQPLTNALLQSNIVAVVTNQALTNAALQAGIDAVGTGTWSLAMLTDGSRSANYLNIVNTNYLGADIVTNGAFTGSASNWSLSSFYYSGNRVILNPSLVGSIEYTNTLVVTTNKMYQLTVGTTYAGAAVTASVGGVTSSWTSVSGSTRTEYFYAINNSKIVISAATGTNSLELDDIILKECPTGSIFVAQDVNAGNTVRARVAVLAPNITSISNLAAAAVPGPTNTWTAGYFLATSDGGTTTYATSAGAGDFLADGTVPMTGDLNGGANDATNFANLIYTNDVRLTNSRPPDAHNQALATITNAGTMAAASTGDYYTASAADATFAATGTVGDISVEVDTLNSKTSAWDTASTDASSATGAIAVIQASTDTWNTAATDASSATGGVATLNYLTNSIVYTNDSRLTDSRDPNAHNQGWETITGTPDSADGYGMTNEFIYEGDSRLDDARSWDSPNYNTITNPPTIPTTNGLAGTNDYPGTWQGHATGDFDSAGSASTVQTDLDDHKTNTGVHAISAIVDLQSTLDGKLGTNDPGTGLTGVWHPGDEVTNAVDEQARANNALTSNAIPTNAVQINAAQASDFVAVSNACPVLEGSANVHVTPTPTGQVVSVDSGTVDYGITDTTAYRGDWGHDVSGRVAAVEIEVDVLNTNTASLPSYLSTSNLAYSASTNAEAARVIASNAQAVADAALPKSSTNALAVTKLQITGLSGNGVVPVGAVQMYGGAAAPAGWLLCDGASVATNTYPALFTAISTNFGSTNAAWFNLPDMRGVFPKGAGVTTRVAGKDATTNAYSAVLGTYYTDRFQGHWHDARMDTVEGSNNEVSLKTGTTTGAAVLHNVRDPLTDLVNGTPRTGASTEPQSLGINFIIKY